MSGFLTLRTFADLLQYGYRLAVHCPRCNRWHQVDLAGMVERGQGEREYIGLVFRCRDCGQIGEVQLQTPDAGQVSRYPSDTPSRA